MAVTLFSDDLVQPAGELSDVLFPDGNIGELVAGWLRDAKTKVANVAETEQDGAAAAWVYYRAYRHVADRMASAPSHMIAGPRTEDFDFNQRKYFAERADYWLDIYYSLNLTVPQAAIPAFFGTVKARTCTWP